MIINHLKSPNLKCLQKYCHSLNTKRALTSDSEYIQVPHYREKSALFIRQNMPNATKSQAPVFPRLITPELNLKGIFEEENMYKSALSINLNARHIFLDLERLKEDYLKMKDMEDEINQYEALKEQISNQVNHLVKTVGKQVKNTDEFRDLIRKGNDIKVKENKILEELIPLQEIVQISCLRLPNNLHISSLLVHALQKNTDFFTHVSSSSPKSANEFVEENNSVVLFRLNDETRPRNLKRLDTASWKSVLSSADNWSFIEQSHNDRMLGNRYLTGEYSQLEHAIVDFVYAKLHYLNNLQEKNSESFGKTFEHIKTVSMLKTAVIEGSGHYPTKNNDIYNIVSFSGDPNHIDLLHLTGSSTVSSLLLQFVRSSINPKYLPWTVFTNGKRYSPNKGQINKFEMLTLCAEQSEFMFDKTKITNETNLLDISSILSSKGQVYLDRIQAELKDFQADSESQLKDLFNPSKSIDDLIIDHLKLCMFIYKDLNIPMRFNFLNANELENNEALEITFNCLLPSEQKYIKVGSVSLLNEYLSERLQVRLANEKKDEPVKHVSMISATLMNVNSFLRILVESNMKQSEHDSRKFEFNIPAPLEKYYTKYMD